MSIRACAFAVAAFSVMGSVHPVLADDQAGWISRHDLVEKLEQQGYGDIDVEQQGDHWEGKAVKDGTVVEFTADAHSGDVIDLSLPNDDEDGGESEEAPVPDDRGSRSFNGG